MLLRFTPSPVPTVTDADIARGWQIWKTRTNEIDFTMSANAVRNEDWFWFGGHSMFDFVRFGGDWVFPYGTQELSRVTVLEDGGLRVRLSQTTDEIRAASCPLAAFPQSSQFWHTTNGFSRVFTWYGFFANGDTNTVVNAQITLLGNGDFVTRSNEVETLFRRIEPFDLDGDGLPNECDSRPTVFGDDCYGQSDDWVRANFTNAEEILAVGYAEWVDEQVGIGLENGFYKFTATFLEPPRRTTLLTVGDLKVCVTNAGEYTFLLGKGVYYELALSSECSVTYEAVDDVASRRMMLGKCRSNEFAPGGHWTVDYGRLDLVVPFARAPFAPPAHIVWYPELSVSPATWRPHPRSAEENFSAFLKDLPWFVRPSYCWQTADTNIVSINSETMRMANFICKRFDDFFWDASLRLIKRIHLMRRLFVGCLCWGSQIQRIGDVTFLLGS